MWLNVFVLKVVVLVEGVCDDLDEYVVVADFVVVVVVVRVAAVVFVDVVFVAVVVVFVVVA